MTTLALLAYAALLLGVMGLVFQGYAIWRGGRMGS